MTKKQRRELKKIIIALVFFIAALFTKRVEFLTTLLSGVAFFVCGYKSVVRAIENIVRLNPLDEHFLMTVASIGAFFIGEPVEGAAVMVFYQH